MIVSGILIILEEHQSLMGDDRLSLKHRSEEIRTSVYLLAKFFDLPVRRSLSG
jgi:hypothetical protein